MTVLVEGELENNGAEYYKALVKVRNDTIIYNEEGLESEVKSLELGQYVTVFFEGNLMVLTDIISPIL